MYFASALHSYILSFCKIIDKIFDKKLRECQLPIFNGDMDRYCSYVCKDNINKFITCGSFNSKFNNYCCFLLI